MTFLAAEFPIFCRTLSEGPDSNKEPDHFQVAFWQSG